MIKTNCESGFVIGLRIRVFRLTGPISLRQRFDISEISRFADPDSSISWTISWWRELWRKKLSKVRLNEVRLGGPLYSCFITLCDKSFLSFVRGYLRNPFPQAPPPFGTLFSKIYLGGGKSSIFVFYCIFTFRQPLLKALDRWRASGGSLSTPSCRSCVGDEGGVGPDLLCGEVSL